MSPDDIFAAHMWPWPDPLLKRNPAGQVVFVNAAFLQLYGGRVENWAGHPVQGWPAPNSQGAPYRFETRVPGPTGEIIYDWVEVTMGDGNALAIARDVTVFRQEPLTYTPTIEPQMAPPVNIPAASAAPQSAPVFAQAPAQIQAPVQAPAIESIELPREQLSSERTVEEPASSISANAPAVQTPDIRAPQIDPPHIEAPIIDTPQIDVPDAMTLTPQQAPQAAPVGQPAETRSYERRALPIEDGDAVLGSNWRDAVIAKAVGTDLSATEATSDAATQDASPEPETEQQTGQGLKILLAEDNAINALLTRTLLEAEGCIVDTVEDGALAVQAMQNNTYDLIFMDMRMPNMDGLEATRKIRAMGPRTAELPIIALTANAFDDDRNACFDSGMNDFMTKPVSAEELSQMVKTWTAERESDTAAA